MATLLERALRAIQPSAVPPTSEPTTRRQQDIEQFERNVAEERRRLQDTIDQEQQRLRQRMAFERQFRELITPPFTAAEIALAFGFHLAVGPYAYLDLEFAYMPVRYSLWSLPDVGWIRLQGRSLNQLFPWSDVALPQAPQRLLEVIARDYRQWTAQQTTP